jgi:hypothetical protein
MRLEERTVYAPFRRRSYQTAQAVEVARQAVHASASTVSRSRRKFGTICNTVTVP